MDNRIYYKYSKYLLSFKNKSESKSIYFNIKEKGD